MNNSGQIDFFDINLQRDIKKDGPLAARLRPETIEDFIGQEDIIAPGKLLYRMIKSDKISSIIFYGPPGSGKTTLAKIIANTTKAYFQQLNAVASGVSDIKMAVNDAKNRRGMYNQKTILFIDEIHRFNKSQQDALLPFVEDGTVILIGATTENPYFEVNDALISRSTIFKLKPLSKDNIIEIVKRALKDEKKGLGIYNIKIAENVLEFIADLSNGDARIALNAIELAVLTSEKDEDGCINIDILTIQECFQKKSINYDKKGENHYDTISAFIKSMRGSDPDAAIHYLARMIYAGEDPMFIARRIMICAAEDVGNADPNALSVAAAAANAVHLVGMPEARIILSQAAIYIACAPKSNACYSAIKNALQDVEKKDIGEIPLHLRNNSFKGASDWNYGVEYKYPHDYENNYVEQQYLPSSLKGISYYKPTDNGYEKKMKEHLDHIKKYRNT